jgi:hypothetical protein
MRTGRTLTAHFDLDTRQHELLGLDLGEGAPRRMLVLGLALFMVWTGGLFLIFGLPNRFTFTAYVLPPGLIAYFGTQRSSRINRRWNITNWALAVRYLVLGHRPIICGGRRAATRSEWIPRRSRWGARGDAMSQAPGARMIEGSLGRPEIYHASAGAPLRLDARPRLYGPDQLYKARQQGER